jgi:hypothetical protein
MVDVEEMTRYTTVAIYMAPVVLSMPFVLWILTPFITQVFPAFAGLNINLATWYVTFALGYLTTMWILEMFWSSIDVAYNGGEIKNITFGAILFAIMAIFTGVFTGLVYFQLYTFSNVLLNAIIASLEVLGIGLFIWQSRSVLVTGERKNHVFAMGSNA